MRNDVQMAPFKAGRVAYEVSAEGEHTLVFVHGYSGDRTHWRHQLEGLDVPGHRLVAVDLLGHGESDKPEVQYTMELFARGVAAVLDDLGADRATLVGHSNGVPVVRQFYRLFPQRTVALVAVDGALRQIPRHQMEMMIEPLRQPDWRESIERMVGQLSKISGHTSVEDIEIIKRTTLATPHHVLLGAAEAMMDSNMWLDDPIEVPLLVVTARTPFSDMWTDEYQAHVRRLAPQVDYRVWEDVTHALMMEYPERFNRMIEEFLATAAC